MAPPPAWEATSSTIGGTNTNGKGTGSSTPTGASAHARVQEEGEGPRPRPARPRRRDGGERRGEGAARTALRAGCYRGRADISLALGRGDGWIGGGEGCDEWGGCRQEQSVDAIADRLIVIVNCHRLYV